MRRASSTDARRTTTSGLTASTPTGSGAETAVDYTGSHRAEPTDPEGGDTDGVDRRDVDGEQVQEGERPTWQERARDRADDVLGRRDTDGDGRRG